MKYNSNEIIEYILNEKERLFKVYKRYCNRFVFDEAVSELVFKIHKKNNECDSLKAFVGKILLNQIFKISKKRTLTLDIISKIDNEPINIEIFSDEYNLETDIIETFDYDNKERIMKKLIKNLPQKQKEIVLGYLKTGRIANSSLKKYNTLKANYHVALKNMTKKAKELNNY